MTFLWDWMGALRDWMVLLVLGLAVPLVSGSDFDPVVLLSIAVVVTVIGRAHQSPVVQLSARDSRVANWFLFNGGVIHLVDGLVGGLGKVATYRVHMERVDHRYRDFEATVVGISFVELFITAPLCCAVYYGYKQGKAWRPGVEICCATFQLMGALLFAGTEVGSGFAHIPADRDLSFSSSHLVYFWFGFVLTNILWIGIALRLIVTGCFHLPLRGQKTGTTVL